MALRGRASERPCYLVNGSDVGRGREGFDAVLALIRARPDAQVMIAIGGALANTIQQTAPFADRLNELCDAVGRR